LNLSEKLRGGERTLESLTFELPEETDKFIPAEVLADPEQPMDSEEFLEKFIPEEVGRPAGRRLRNFAILFFLMLVLAAAWRWTPLGDWLNLARASAWLNYLRAAPTAPFIILGGYLVGSLILIPVTLLIVATTLVFGPLAAFGYSLLGCLASALLTYSVGRLLGRDPVRRLAGSRLNQVSRRLADHGVMTVLAVRILPIAPYTVVNMVAGASHIRLRDFVLGTILGMAPGVLAITLFEHQLVETIHEPGLVSLAILAALLVVIVLAYLLLKRWLGNNQQDKSTSRHKEDSGS